MNKSELKKILKDKEIPYFSYWSKQRLIDLAREHNLLPTKKEKPEKKKREEPEKPKYVNYERLKHIRSAPIKVVLKDVNTEEEHTFPSIYKAAQFIDKSPQTIRHWGRKKGIWNDTYQVTLV